MLIFEKIAEEKIKEWIEKEDFTKNKFYGKKVDNTEYFKVPETLRIAYHILKNANVLPKELQLKSEIIKLRDLLEEISDEDEFIKKLRQFQNKISEYNILSNSKPTFNNEEFYTKKLMKKIIGFSISEIKSQVQNR